MNLSELRTDIYDYLDTTSGGRFTTAKVDAAINRAAKRIHRLRRWRFLRKTIRLETVVTQLAAAATAGASTLSVDSASGMGKNRWLYIVDGSDSEEAKISSISETTITLASVLENAHAIDVYVAVRDIFLPEDCGKIVSIRTWGDVQRRLANVRVCPFDHTTPQPQVVSEPSQYYLAGYCRDIEGPYTADAGTGTTTIVDSELTAAGDDYYNGWMAVNRMRSLQARISDYVASTKILTLDRAIASQASTDSYHLLPELDVIQIYPFPPANRYLRLRYLADATMVNTYDLPLIPEAYHRLLVLGAVEELAIKDRYNPKAQTSWQAFKAEYQQLLGEMEDDDSIRAVDTAGYYDREEDDWSMEAGY